MDQQQRPSCSSGHYNIRSVNISDLGFAKRGNRLTSSALSGIFGHCDQSLRCGSSIESECLQSQWEVLMRKFSKDQKRLSQTCRSWINDDLRCEWRNKKTFATGSSYDGTWDGLGLCGYGHYTFPNGVEYVGDFEDSMFHGDGELRYPDGIVLKGRWHHGEILEKTIIFGDGVKYNDGNWEYCKSPDRRFARECYQGIQAAGKQNLTNELPPKKIPEGEFDSGSGSVYDPKKNTIHAYDNPDASLKIPNAKTVKWVKDNCRTNPDQPVGPCPHFYKEWLEPTLQLEEPPPAPACKDDMDMAASIQDTFWNISNSSKIIGKKGRSASFFDSEINLDLPD